MYGSDDGAEEWPVIVAVVIIADDFEVGMLQSSLARTIRWRDRARFRRDLWATYTHLMQRAAQHAAEWILNFLEYPRGVQLDTYYPPTEWYCSAGLSPCTSHRIMGNDFIEPVDRGVTAERRIEENRVQVKERFNNKVGSEGFL